MLGGYKSSPLVSTQDFLRNDTKFSHWQILRGKKSPACGGVSKVMTKPRVEIFIPDFIDLLFNLKLKSDLGYKASLLAHALNSYIASWKWESFYEIVT